MTDSLDTSEFLPRRVPIVSKWRAQHGDITGAVADGRIMYATAIDTSIAADMTRRGLLEPHHVGYGLDFMELRRTIFGCLDASRMLRIGDCSLKKSHAAEIYEEVRKGVGGGDEKILVVALAPKQTDPKFQNLTKIRCAFDNLVSCMESVLSTHREKLLAEGDF